MKTNELLEYVKEKLWPKEEGEQPDAVDAARGLYRLCADLNEQRRRDSRRLDLAILLTIVGFAVEAWLR